MVVFREDILPESGSNSRVWPDLEVLVGAGMLGKEH